MYSHSGYVQEDSGGFAILAGLLAKTLQVDVAMESVTLNELGTQVTVRTKNGGKGVARFDKGFTPWEARLMQQLAGMKSCAPQTLAQQVLGRISGQGSNQAATVLCEAIAKAIMNSLYQANPACFLFEPDDQPDSSGCFLGTVLDFGEIPVACLLTLNSCKNGIGPNEDTEGNVLTGAKGQLMKALGMDQVPCIVLEGKSYIPEMSGHLEEVQFFIRWNDDYDNVVVAECLQRAALSLGYEVQASGQAYPRGTGELARFTRQIGKEIAQLGESFALATRAHEKIRLAALLADKVRADLGGAVFMSDALNNLVGNGGLWPGSGAVLGLIVPESYIQYWKIPAMIDADIDNGVQILSRAIPLLWQRRKEAYAMCEQRRPASEYTPPG